MSVRCRQSWRAVPGRVPPIAALRGSHCARKLHQAVLGHLLPVKNGSFGAAHKLAVARCWLRIEM